MTSVAPTSSSTIAPGPSAANAGFWRLEWLSSDRVRAYSRMLFVALLILLAKPFSDAIGKAGSDFYAFWAAGKLVVAGHAASAYDPATIGAVQATTGWHEIMAFVNPPAMLPIVAPLGLLPFAAAWIVWVAVTWTLWFLAARRLAPKLGWPIAAWPSGALAAGHAQTGLFTGSLFAFAAHALERRPFMAGLALGALVIKPHLAILVPLALLAGGQWRAIAGAACSAVGMTALAVLLFGTNVLSAYPQSWEVSRQLMGEPTQVFLLRMATVFAQVRLFMPNGPAMAVQIVVSLAVAVVVWRRWRSPGPLDGKLALLAAGTALATPYLFNYDLPFLIVPLVWLACQSASRGWPAYDKLLLAGLYLGTYTARAFALPLGINLTPLVALCLFVLVARRTACPAGELLPR